MTAAPPTADRAQQLVRARRVLPHLLVGAVFLLQLDRLVSFTVKHAVNILYWDQWDFYTPLFEHASLWRIFAWQHGPPRLGVGLVFTRVVAGLTHWNTRTEALATVGVVALAALAALWLKRALFGSLSLTDVVIPVLFLSRAQHELLLGAVDPSHGPFPLLLTMLICLAWLQPNRLVRYALVVALNFLLVFTAFGLLMGLITPLLLAFDCSRALREREKPTLAAGIATLAAALASLGCFLIGYTLTPGSEAFRFPYGNVLAYPLYAGLVLANVVGFKAHYGAVPDAVGIALLLGMVGTLFHNARLIARSDGDAPGRSRIVVILIGFSLLFSFAAAIGRLPLGLDTADSSRYYLYATIGVLGLYFHLLALRTTAVRRWALAAVVVAALVAGFHTTRLDQDTINHLTNGKRSWQACYLRTEDITGCDKAAGFVLYPRPEVTGLKAKLEYLKRNRLNLYGGDP